MLFRSIDPQLLQAVRDGMWLVVNGSGTGARARIAGHDVVGKTGTAQVISNEAKAALAGKSTRDLRDHGLFVFFAPRDHRPLPAWSWPSTANMGRTPRRWRIIFCRRTSRSWTGAHCQSHPR